MFFVMKDEQDDNGENDYQLYTGPYGSKDQAEKAAVMACAAIDATFMVVRVETAYKHLVKVDKIVDPSIRAVES